MQKKNIAEKAAGLAISATIIVIAVIYSTPRFFGVEWKDIHDFWWFFILSPFSMNANNYVSDTINNNISAKIVYNSMIYAPFISFMVVFIVSYVYTSKSSNDVHLRGRELVSVEKLRKLTNNKKASVINFDGVYVPIDELYSHYCMCGTTGTGKSVGIKVMIDALQKIVKCIIIDNGFDMLKRYYSKERCDAFLNPLYEKSKNWSILAEIQDIHDCDRYASSIISASIAGGARKDETFLNFARTLISAVLEYLYTKSPDATNSDILYYICVAKQVELQTILDGTAAASFVAPGNEKMFGSIQSTAADAIKCYRYLSPKAGRLAWSIRSHMEKTRGWIFISYKDSEIQSLRPLISQWMDIAISAGMVKETNDMTMYIMDEFDTIGKVHGVIDLLSKGRKYGAVACIGIQNYSQVRARYGVDDSQTILGLCNTWLCYRNAEKETASYISNMLGTREIRHEIHGHSRGAKGGASENQSEQVTISPLVLPSQVAELPALHCYIMIPGDFPIAKIKLSLPPLVKSRIKLPQRRKSKAAMAEAKDIRDGEAQKADQSCSSQAEQEGMHGETEKNIKAGDIAGDSDGDTKTPFD